MLLGGLPSPQSLTVPPTFCLCCLQCCQKSICLRMPFFLPCMEDVSSNHLVQVKSYWHKRVVAICPTHHYLVGQMPRDQDSE